MNGEAAHQTSKPTFAPEMGDPAYGSFMGDVNADFSNQYAQIGDIEEGAPVIDSLVAQYIGDLQSDMEDGDAVDPSEMAGDVEEGGPRRRRRLQKRMSKAAAKLKKLGGSTTSKLKAERTLAGKINPMDQLPFVSAQGMVIQTIDAFPAGSTFVAENQKTSVDTCQLQTPGVGIVVTSSTPNVQFGTSYGATAYYLYPFFLIKLGTNLLNGVAGTIITIQALIPTINGTRNTINITAQMTDKFNGTVVIYPYLLVAGRPQAVIGKVGGDAGTTDELLVTITGLPASVSTASIIIPQSAYPLFIAYRNALA